MHYALFLSRIDASCIHKVCKMLQLSLPFGPVTPISRATSACRIRRSRLGNNADQSPSLIGDRSSRRHISGDTRRLRPIFCSNCMQGSRGVILPKPTRLMKRIPNPPSNTAKTRTSRNERAIFLATNTFAETALKRPKKSKSTSMPFAKNGRVVEQTSHLSRHQRFHCRLRGADRSVGSCLVDFGCHRSERVFGSHQRADLGGGARSPTSGWRRGTRRSLPGYSDIGGWIGCRSCRAQALDRGGNATQL